MDRIDHKIVAAMSSHSRIAIKDLAALVNMAPPSVAERLKRLEERGVIEGYTIIASPASLGYSLQAIVRINPLPGAMRAVERLIEDTPQIIECDRVTGEDCFHARLCCRSMDDLDRILEPFHELARTNTALVKSQAVRRRLPPLADPHSA